MIQFSYHTVFDWMILKFLTWVVVNRDIIWQGPDTFLEGSHKWKRNGVWKIKQFSMLCLLIFANKHSSVNASNFLFACQFLCSYIYCAFDIPVPQKWRKEWDLSQMIQSSIKHLVLWYSIQLSPTARRTIHLLLSTFHFT